MNGMYETGQDVLSTVDTGVTIISFSDACFSHYSLIKPINFHLFSSE